MGWTKTGTLPAAVVTDANVATQVASGTATGVAVAAKIAQLKAWAKVPETIINGAITRDSNGAATAFPVKWPDGSPGNYTADTLSTAFPGAVDAYHVTYGSPVTKTFTQSAVTRDTSGAATNVPDMAVS